MAADSGNRPIAPRLVQWAERHGRHDLPWQRPATPYRVWVSEVMLQQTQVATVIPYFQRFMERCPDLGALARTPLDDVLALWSGLGYYARARNLHAAARRCVDEHGGELPATAEALRTLPGIGRSTAGAILALGFGRRAAILDGNAKRVLARYHAVPGWPGTSRTLRRLWEIAEVETPRQDVGAYTQAIMDLGATVCTRQAPDCALCPLEAGCIAHARGRETAYPAPRPRRERPRRRRTFLWIERADGRLLLEQRPPAGVWGGLLCLPEVRENETAGQWCRRRLGNAPGETTTLAGFRHELTHFRLEGAVVAVDVQSGALADDASLRWRSPGEALAAGLPAPMRDYIRSRAAAADG